jgi:hypothetical protein
MNSICRISLNRALVALALVALLVLPCATPSFAAQAPQKETVVSDKHETPLEAMIRKRIAAGFSVLGPTELKKASSSALVVDNSPSDGKTISLAKKRVTVLDESGNSSSTSSLAEGTWVIICQKKDEIVIYLVKGYKKGTRNAE